MTVRIEVPRAVADELVAEGGFVIPMSERAIAGEVFEVAMTALNAGAVVVTLAQGPDALRRAVGALRRQDKHQPAGSCLVRLEGPNGSIEVKVDDSTELDFDSLVRQVSTGASTTSQLSASDGSSDPVPGRISDP